jgi:hypothetical protein
MHASGKNRGLELFKTSSAWFQSFRYINENIVNARGLVLEIEGNRCKEGGSVIAWKKHNGKNQRWIVRYEENNGSDIQRKGKDSYFGFILDEPFYATPKCQGSQAIEVVNGRNLALNKFDRGKETMQFMLESNTKTIKSVAYKDQSWNIEKDGESNNMQIYKTNNRWFQMFKLVGDRIQNERGQFVGAKGSGKGGDPLFLSKRASNSCFNWNIRYVKNEQTYLKGEFHDRYGFYCDREFYIVSERDGRYLQHLPSRIVATKTRNGFN